MSYTSLKLVDSTLHFVDGPPVVDVVLLGNETEVSGFIPLVVIGSVKFEVGVVPPRKRDKVPKKLFFINLPTRVNPDTPPTVGVVLLCFWVLAPLYAGGYPVEKSPSIVVVWYDVRVPRVLLAPVVCLFFSTGVTPGAFTFAQVVVVDSMGFGTTTALHDSEYGGASS
jgi:hypothetical protein